ncbi:MAG: hypothetical protein ABWZ25_08740 [Chitinophagaceae bacterium]
MDHFEFVVNWRGIKMLTVTSDGLAEQVSFCKKTGFGNLSISQAGEFYEDNLEFLRNLEAKHILLMLDGITNIGALNTQVALESLDIPFGSAQELLDFSNWPKLNFFRGYWNENLKNLFATTRLTYLHLWKLKTTSRNLTELQQLEKLETLGITQSNLVALEGLAAFAQLKELNLAYNATLVHLANSPGDFKHLKKLEIESCNKLETYEIRLFKGLNELQLFNCGKVPSLAAIISELPDLRLLDFTKTEIDDTNFNFLLEHPSLEEVSFDDKRKYPLKCYDVNVQLAARKKKK